MERKTKNHYVAYMDILGYKDYLKTKPEESEQYLQTILDAINHVKESTTVFKKTSEQFQIEGELKYKVFSDNILLCLPFEQSENEIRRATVFLIMVASIQRGLALSHGLLVRGGVTLGDLFINDDIVFGQGLVDAVELESKTEHPCITVSDNFLSFLSGCLKKVDGDFQTIMELLKKEKLQGFVSKEETAFLSENTAPVSSDYVCERSLQELIRHYDKESHYLNYLFNLSFPHLLGTEHAQLLELEAAKDPKKFEGIVGTYNDVRIHLWAHKAIVVQKIKEYCNYNDVDKSDSKAVAQRESIIRKYLWLLRYHNGACAENGFFEGLCIHKIDHDLNFLRLVVKVEE